MSARPPTELPAQPYDEYYFRHGCGLPYERNEHWLRFFGAIADRIVSAIGPRTVLDAGCAMGFLVEALRARGVEAFGLDISEYALQQVSEPIRPFCRLGSIVDPLPERYDLIVCIEVLEHLVPGDSERALANLCQATDDLLFSSTPDDFREASHQNVQPPDYWARLFAEQGFVRDVDFDAGLITPWALRLRRSGERLPRLAANYERKFWRLWQENQALRHLTHEMRAQLANQERELRAQVVNHERELRTMKSSIGWQLTEVLGPWRRRLAPPASGREHALYWLVRVLRKRPPRSSKG